jgi:hypothetical protein
MGSKGGAVAETSSSETTVGKFVGAPIMAAIGAWLGWLTGGPTGALGSAPAQLLAIGGGTCGLIFALIYARNVGVLGAGGEEKDTPERQAYDALRKSLAEGSLAARLYARWLTSFLDAVDRFFGDALHLGQRAFGLRTPAPLWTAASLNRCLLLALIYPIATIFIFWAISGHVGPAENALHLHPRLGAWQRWLATAVFGISVFALSRAVRETRWKRLISILVCIITFVLAVALSVAPLGAMVVGDAHAALHTTKVNLVQAPTFPIVPVIVAFVGSVSIAAMIVVVSAVLGALRRLNPRWEGAFLSLFIPAMILACLGAAAWLSSLRFWQMLGPLLLFLGLLTLANAPFDWASLGMTRALLRRGLELGGWWPCCLAIVDVALAAIIVGVLVVATVVGIQLFDSFAAYGGGRSVLPLEPMFKGIAEQPTAPEHWWIYALLLSTMIPSLINLMIGGASLARGIIPGIATLLLSKLPIGRAVPAFDRTWIATVLTIQTVGGGLLGIAVPVLLAWVIIRYAMPFSGQEFLDLARNLADFNFPARMGQLFGVTL